MPQSLRSHLRRSSTSSLGLIKYGMVRDEYRASSEANVTGAERREAA